MGGFTEAMAVVSAIGAATSMVGQIQQAGAAKKQQEQQAQALWQQQQQRAKQQRDLLKRQLASTRAALAGGGIGFAGGSGQALMEGMTRTAEENIRDGYDTTLLQHELKFGDGSGGAAEGIMNGLNVVQQGFQVMKPFVK